MMDPGSLEDDPIEEEILIYCPKLDDGTRMEMCAFQYPLQTVGTQEEDEVQEVKYKSSQQRIQIKTGLDPRNRTFDVQKAEELAMNKAGTADGEVAKEQMKDYMVTEGGITSKDVKRYGVFTYQNGCIHLLPLSHWFQMRPSYEHMDKPTAGGEEDGLNVWPENEGASKEPEDKNLMIKFARNQSERAKKAQERSLGHLQRVSEKEPWVDLKYAGVKSEKAQEVLESLACAPQPSDLNDLNEDEDIKDVKMSLGAMGGWRRRMAALRPEDAFVEGLFPIEQTGPVAVKGEDGDKKANFPAGEMNLVNMSMLQLRVRPLVDRIAAVAARAKVVHYSEMCELMLPEAENEVLRGLMACCYLVQGCWVVRSDQVYKSNAVQSTSGHGHQAGAKKEPKGGVTGVSLEILSRARDFICYHFHKNRFVDKTKMKDALRLPMAELTAIFKEMSKPDENRSGVYEFIFPSDMDFVTKFSDVVERQAFLWEAKYQLLTRALKIDETTPNPNASPTLSPARRRRRTRSQRDSTCSVDEPLAK